MREMQLAVAKENNDFLKLRTTILNTSIIVEQEYGVDSAISLLQEGLTYRNKYADNGNTEGKLYANLATCFFENDNHQAALNSATKSIHFLEHFNDAETISYRLDAQMVLAQLNAQKGNLTIATGQTKNIIAQGAAMEETERERTIGKTYLLLADLYQQDGKPAAQLAAINKALYTVCDIDTSDLFATPASEDLYAENTIMEALDTKAKWMAANAKVSDPLPYLKCSIRCCEASFKVEDLLMNDYGYDESKLMQLKESRRRSELAIGVCIQLLEATSDKQWAEKAFLFAEQNKARVLQENISRNIAGNDQFAKDSFYVKMKGLVAKEHELETAIYSQQLRPAADTAAIYLLKAQLVQVQQQKFNADVALKQSNPGYKKMLVQKDSLLIKHIFEQLLTSNTHLVEYFSGDSAAYVFHLQGKNQSIQIHTLSPAARHLAGAYLHWFAQPSAIENNTSGFLQVAFALYRQLLEPVLQHIENGELIVIADGLMGQVPFESLVTSAPQNSRLHNAAYLIKKCKIFYGYSAKLLLQKSQQKQKTGSINIAMAPVNVFPASFGGAALENSIAETAAFKTAFKDAVVYTKKEASLAAFKASSSNAGMLHIATHAVADSVQPYIVFADSILYMQQLYGMQVPAKLVVLSACKTTLGRQQQGEGTMSLARGFSYAGAQNVITSLWEVNDRSTADFMAMFYDELKNNNPGESLCLTKLKWLERAATNGHIASPYYWAAFINYGYSPSEAGNKQWLVILLAIAVVAGTIIFTWQKKKTRQAA